MPLVPYIPNEFITNRIEKSLSSFSKFTFFRLCQCHKIFIRYIDKFKKRDGHVFGAKLSFKCGLLFKIKVISSLIDISAYN